jgi:plasmid stability protein
MAQLLVRNLDDEIVTNLKSLAKKHKRSLQSEVKSILEREAKLLTLDDFAFAARIRKKLAAITQTDSIELIRSDRNR